MRAAALTLGVSLAVAVGLPPAVNAETFHTQERCENRFQAQIEQLQALIRQLEDPNLPQDEISRIFGRIAAWQTSFRAEIKQAATARLLAACERFFLPTTGELGIPAQMVIGGTGAAATPYMMTETTMTTLVGSTIGAAMIAVGFVDQSIANIRTIANWTQIDQNTALYEWLIDYTERDRVNPIDDNLRGFLRNHQALLERLFTKFNPEDDGSATRFLRLWGHQMLLYFGRYEELAGPQKFPRVKINVAGRFGGGRYDTGYYRKVLANYFRKELIPFQQQLAALQARICKPECKPPQNALPGVTPVNVEVGGGGGKCVISESGSREELRTVERPPETPTTAPPTTPPGTTTKEEPKQPPVTTAEPEPKAPPRIQTVERPPRISTVERPPKIKTVERHPEPPTVVFVKASQTVTDGTTPKTSDLNGATIQINVAGAPPLPGNGQPRTQTAENADASASPTRCKTDDKGECVIKFDPEDPIDLPDPADLGRGLDGPRQTAGKGPYKLSINTRPTDSVVVPVGAAAGGKRGSLDDGAILRRRAGLRSSDDTTSIDHVRFAALGGMSTVAAPKPGPVRGGIQLAQQAAGTKTGGNDQPAGVRLPPGVDISFETVKIGGKDYVRISARGFNEGALAEWVKTTWGFTVIIDPCRDPQPGPPVGMTPQRSCGAPDKVAAQRPAQQLPVATISLTALYPTVPGSERR